LLKLKTRFIKSIPFQDDKYLLKFPPTNVSSNEMKNQDGRFNPITKINLILVRQSAVDKNTFFLINTNVSQMLELTAPSSSECKTYVFEAV
jgi:PH domain